MNLPASKPLVYSCSGCSSAAQLANAVALKLDRAEIAEMSCIAGVGGAVPSLLRTAKSGRPLVSFDPAQAQRVFANVSRQIARALPEHGAKPSAPVQPKLAEGARS